MSEQNLLLSEYGYPHLPMAKQSGSEIKSWMHRAITPGKFASDHMQDEIAELRAALSARPVAQPVLTDAQIKEIFLANGFTVKWQDGGHYDLNSYVYRAARAIIAATRAQAVSDDTDEQYTKDTPEQYLKRMAFLSSERNRLNAVDAQAASDDVADMFWDADDGENNADSIEELIENTGLEIGEEMGVSRARNLPNIRVRRIEHPTDSVDYEIIGEKGLT